MNKFEEALQGIKSGKVSLYSAKEMIGDSLTAEQEKMLRVAHNAVMNDVCDHQDKMSRAMREGR